MPRTLLDQPRILVCQEGTEVVLSHHTLYQCIQRHHDDHPRAQVCNRLLFDLHPDLLVGVARNRKPSFRHSKQRPHRYLWHGHQILHRSSTATWCASCLA